MIKLENIQITFDRPLILDGSLEIHPGVITLLKGPSGSGKSSILDLVGLLKNNPHLQYTFNGQKLVYSDHLFAKYRQNEIGYVLQDYALLDHLSIFQNLSWYANMINHSLTKQEAYSLLEDVGLFLDLDTPITVLSGGERQRVAIACALLKHPSLLILDEPTSALDDDNAKMVMDTLKDLAKKGYMILLASHASFVENYCDVIYEIKNQHLNCIKDQHSDCFLKSHFKNQPLSIKFYFTYFFNFFKKNILIQSILIVIVGMSFSFFLLSDDFLEAFEQKQTMLLNDIANLEILVISDKIDPNFIHYNPHLPPLKKEHLDAIEKIEHITNIQPFYEGVGGPHIKTDKGDFNLYFAIQPYYGNKIVASYQLDYHLNHARKLSFDFYLPDNSVVPFNELVIEEVLPIENKNHYSLADDVLYIPYHLFPQAPSTQALLVQVDHFKNMHIVKSNILNVDDNKNIACYHRPFNNTEMNSILESIETMIPLLQNMMIVLITILVFFVYTRHIGQRKKEIWLLKINGLSKTNTLLLVSIEMFTQALLISLFSLMSEQLLLLILKNTMNISLSISIIHDLIINFLLSLILLFVPMLLSLLAYQRKDLATSLRNG